MSQNRPSRAPFCFSGAVSSSSSEISYQQASNFSSLFSLPNLRAFPVASGRFSSVQLLSHVLLFATPWTAARQAFMSNTNSQSLPNWHPLSRWCHPTISSSVVPFSSCLQYFPALGSFLMSQFFPSGGQSIGASASESVLPVNIQGGFLLGLTGLIPLKSKGLSRVFSNTTVQKHQFFCAQLSL